MDTADPRHISPVLGTSLPSSARLSRPRHVSPVLGTSLSSSARLSRPRHVSADLSTILDGPQRFWTPTRTPRRCHVHPGGTTSIQATPGPSQRHHSFPNDAMTFQTMPRLSPCVWTTPTLQGVLKPSRAFSNPPGRSLTLQGVL